MAHPGLLWGRYELLAGNLNDFEWRLTVARHTDTAALPPFTMSLVLPEAHQQFQHILRLLNTNVDGKRKIMYALTEIKGVGRRYSNLVCKKADVDLNKRAGELNSDELERIVTIIQNPTQFKIPTWFLNRQRDIVDGKNSQILSNGVDSKLRDDLERLKKIRAHRGLRHSWGLRVRGQHTKTTGRRGKTVDVFAKFWNVQLGSARSWVSDSVLKTFRAHGHLILTMATWAAQPAHHPWFKMPSLKRKHSTEDDADSSSSSSSPTLVPRVAHLPKRRRCSPLERGFAGLTLNNYNFVVASVPDITIQEEGYFAPPSSVPDVYAPTRAFPPPISGSSMDTEMASPCSSSAATPVPVSYPSQVESPADTTAPDIRMHSSSWYEPEKDRIVITDLDGSSSSDEDENEDKGKADAPLVVSPAVLDRLKQQQQSLSPFSPEGQSMALVLFRPLDPLGRARVTEEEEDVQDVSREIPRTPSPVPIAEDVDDAMDIGY
ncbi:hypothetical protein EW146_g5011 [Bondarzewia mesenterica]|uniref:40S ribosomal protein S18 n=1 Tax=Bondarzewia mesenterica TaxID=1095465 RepID=A0A4S4LUW4_9AGAM|nr:hypothetical protein EW146_g5011 [Bondarzewia mesenterica]